MPELPRTNDVSADGSFVFSNIARSRNFVLLLSVLELVLSKHIGVVDAVPSEVS